MIVGILLAALSSAQPDVGWPPAPDFKKHVDYVKWYEDSVRRDDAPEQNAFELYRAIFPDLADPDVEPPENYGFAGYRHEKNSWDRFKGGPWRPDDFPKWEQSYQRTQMTLETFRRAAARPYRLVPTKNQNGRSGDFRGMQPNNKGIRACVKGLSEAAWRAENGSIDATRFLEYCAAALGAARQLEREPHVNSYLLAIAVRAVLYYDLRAGLAYGVLKPRDRSTVLKILDRLDGELPNLSLMLKGECASIYDYLQVVAAGKGGNESWDQAARISLQIGWADAKKTAKAFRKYFEAVDELSQRPYEPDIADLMEAARERCTKRNNITAMLTPSLSMVYWIYVRQTAERRATRLLYYIHQYRDANGRWPSSLGELDHDVVARFATDPFGGKPFVYKLVEGEPMLYSAGKNARDDGGRHDPRWGTKKPDADFVFWPPQK